MLTRLAKAAEAKIASASVPVGGLSKPRSEVSSSLAGEQNETAPLATGGPRFDFAHVSVAPMIAPVMTPIMAPIQRKPAVNSPGDGFEREADQVAEQAMRHSAPSPAGAAPAAIRHSEKPEISARDGAGVDASAAVQAAERGGVPMPKDLLSFFEPRLGYDFSKVRLHADGEAAEGARSVRARAYTTGRDIVFGAGEYAPNTGPGKRLLAHELTHVAQQRNLVPGGQPSVVMRQPTQPAASPLEQLSDADKQNLQFDTTTTAPNDLRNFFGLKGSPNTATNVDADFEFQTPTIDALKDQKVKTDLFQGLRLYALSAFDLLPGTDNKAHSKRLNLVHLEDLDLARFGGPNTNFRFSCVGSDTKGTIKVRIFIEALGSRSKPLADPAATADIEKRKVTPYGLKRGDSLTDDALWQKVLRALGNIDESLVMRIRDVTFETSNKQVGADGEAAAFDFTFKKKDTGPWTKKFILFQKIISASDADFARILAHEVGHAIDFAPAEKPGGRIDKGEAHNLPKFLEAAKKDGGRGKAITDYGKTSDLEFYAESLSLFVTQPDTFQTLRPNIYQYFVAYEWEAVKDPKLNSPSTVWSTSPKKVP